MLTPRTATIPIYQGDDAEQLAVLRMAVAIAERDRNNIQDQLQAAEALEDSARYGDEPGVTAEDLADANAKVTQAWRAYDEFVDVAADRALEVKVQHIGRLNFRDLVAEHPQRMVDDPDNDGKQLPHDDDYELGINTDTFSRALLTFVDEQDDQVRTIVGPELSDDKALRRFVDVDLNDGDFDRIWRAAYWLNRAPSADPKVLRSSPSTGEISE